MTIPFDFLTDIWNIFLLVLVRISGMFFLSPLFGRRNIPGYYKAGFSFILAILVAHSIPVSDLSGYTTFASYVFLIARELILGLMTGFISYLIFSGIYIAGQIIDMRIGFGMVSVFDPITNIQIPISADFYVIFATLYLFITNSHHLLIKALVDSFTLLPIGEFRFNGLVLKQIVDIFSNVFVTGFKIAAPVTVTIFITDMALGIISKSMPQFNVFMLGMPVKILIGLTVIMLTLVAFRGIINVIMQGTYEEIYKFLHEAKGT
jgi:flagellar biosynthetic protein FliR